MNQPPSRFGEWCEAVLRGGFCVLFNSLKRVAFLNAIATVSMLLLLLAPAQAQTLDLPVEAQEPESNIHFRWANDSWTGQDKIDHGLGGFALMSGASLIFRPNSRHDVWRTAGYSTLFWVFFEAKDGLLKWEDIGYWGGDGASYKDAVWSAAGVGVATALVFLLK